MLDLLEVKPARGAVIRTTGSGKGWGLVKIRKDIARCISPFPLLNSPSPLYSLVTYALDFVLRAIYARAHYSPVSYHSIATLAKSLNLPHHLLYSFRLATPISSQQPFIFFLSPNLCFFPSNFHFIFSQMYTKCTWDEQTLRRSDDEYCESQFTSQTPPPEHAWLS